MDVIGLETEIRKAGPKSGLNLMTRFIRLHPGAQKGGRGFLGDCPRRAASKTSLPTLIRTATLSDTKSPGTPMGWTPYTFPILCGENKLVVHGQSILSGFSQSPRGDDLVYPRVERFLDFFRLAVQ